MKRMIILCTILLVMVSAIGVSIHNTSTASAFSPPEYSGPYVGRTEEGELFVGYIDQKTGLLAIHGVDIVKLCEGNPVFDLVKLQDVHVPEDANRLSELIRGDNIITSVWPSDYIYDCDKILANDPIATGTVKIRQTDNDVVVYLNPDNKNANATGLTAQGLVMSPGGEKFKFHGVSRCVWDGNNESTLKCANKITLR